MCVDARQEMRAHTERLAQFRKQEDPRLSFTTPEFKEASRQFQEAFKVRAVACGQFRETRSHVCPVCVARRKTSASPWSGAW